MTPAPGEEVRYLRPGRELHEMRPEGDGGKRERERARERQRETVFSDTFGASFVDNASP